MTEAKAEQKVPNLGRVDCDLLIDGSGGETVANASVIFTVPDKLGEYGSKGRGKIVYAGPRDKAPALAAGAKYSYHYTVKTVQPGLWDCHCHFFGMKGFDFSTSTIKGSAAAMGARCANDAKNVLEAGFTSVRELGGIGLDLRDAIEDGTINGPNIYSAGGALSITCGHGDFHDLPLHLTCQLMEKVYGANTICDGKDEVLKAVRSQLRRGADCIKVMASGGVLSKRDDPHHREFNHEELSAIVTEAKSKDRVVAAHCHGAAGIKTALDAGCGTIEHGTWLDEKLIAQMKEQDAILVPTIYIQRRVFELGRVFGASEESMVKIAQVMDIHRKAVATAVKAGVRVALGSDIFSSGPDSAAPWGDQAKELEYMVAAGMTPMQAIHCATAMGPQTLGKRGPKSGLLKEGYDADLLALSFNPLDDIKGFQTKTNILGVFKGGRLAVSRFPAAPAAV